MNEIAYIGIGSNLDDPVLQVTRAIEALKYRLPQTTLVKHSRLYWSDSLLPEQPRYCNAVACIETALTPEALLAELQAIETQQGRERRGAQWGPRVIDLDILLFGDQQIALPTLTIPHPQLVYRNFVLYPLYELAPTLHLPDNRSLAEILPGITAIGLEVIKPLNSLV